MMSSLDGPGGQARRAASGDGPDQGVATSAPGQLRTTRAASRPLGEKERVYRELERVQHKCAALKREVKRLRAATGSDENAKLRTEVTTYRQALSQIVYRHDNGELTLASARGLAQRALDDDPRWSKSQRRRRRQKISAEREATL